MYLTITMRCKNNKEMIEILSAKQQAYKYRRKAAIQELKRRNLLNNQNQITANIWREYSIDATHLPVLYRREIVFIFSALFHPIFGALLIYINAKKIKAFRSTLKLVIFSFAFILSKVIISNTFVSLYCFPLFCNIIGAFILYHHFWFQYIPQSVKFQKRNITIPTIITIMLYILKVCFFPIIKMYN